MTNRNPLPRFFRAVALAALSIFVLPFARQNVCAQEPNFSVGRNYIDYPGTRGKVQQFHIQGFPSWLTLDMQIRLRTEDQTSYQYISGNDRIYELTRVWGGMTVRPARRLTAYMQFIDTHALGLPAAHVASNMRDDFDLRQGYLEVHSETAQIYAGRREMRYGDERIIGISDYANNSRTWDGFFGHFTDKSGKDSVDLFSTSVVTIFPESLDKHGAGLTFHGAWGVIGSRMPHGTTLQPFVIVRALPRVKSQQGIYGTETETTFGAESTGNLHSFGFDLMGNLQRGSYSNDSIHSGADIEKVYYTFNKLPWQPRFGGEYDYASGNPRTNPHHISTYDQQYPSNHNAFGFFDLFGFQNIKQQRVNLDLGPTKNLTLLIQGEAIGVASRHDSVYNGAAGTVAAAPTGGFATNSIGDGFDISGKYALHDSIVFNSAWSHYFPGSLMAAAGKGAPLTYAMFSITYRYRVDK